MINRLIWWAGEIIEDNLDVVFYSTCCLCKQLPVSNSQKVGETNLKPL